MQSWSQLSNAKSLKKHHIYGTVLCLRVDIKSQKKINVLREDSNTINESDD